MKRSIFQVIILCFLSLIIFNCKKSSAVPVKNLPTILNFLLSQNEIDLKEIATLTWDVTNATTVEITHIGTVGNSGSVDVSPEETTNYTLTARNSDGAVTRTLTLTVTARAYFELTQWAKKYKSYGSCYIEGKVKNTGNRIGYNVKIEFQAYDGSDTIIDTASGFPADLGDIAPGISAIFEAIFFDTEDWNLIKSLKYTISWLNRSNSVMKQTGIINIR